MQFTETKEREVQKQKQAYQQVQRRLRVLISSYHWYIESITDTSMVLFFHPSKEVTLTLFLQLDVLNHQFLYTLSIPSLLPSEYKKYLFLLYPTLNQPVTRPIQEFKSFFIKVCFLWDGYIISYHGNWNVFLWWVNQIECFLLLLLNVYYM